MEARPLLNSYLAAAPGARSDRADEAQLLEGRDTVVQADLLGDFAVLDAKHGRPSEPHFPASRCRQSEEHTSELQSRLHLVCRLLLEKKKHQPLTIPSNIKNNIECIML